MIKRLSWMFNRKRARDAVLFGAMVVGLGALQRGAAVDVRYVEVQSLLGQRYDAMIDAEDLTTFGLSIPRGTALPRRMYPVRHLGVPMIQRLNEPRYIGVLLRRPQGSHTEYLNPNSETNTVPPTPPVPPVIAVAAVADSNTNRTITISWPASLPDWRVESIPVLGSGDVFWVPVSPSLYATNGDTILYIESLPAFGSKFFRLSQP